MRKGDRFTFVLPGIACASVEFETKRLAYFSRLFVNSGFRQNGLGTELIRFVISYAGVWPEIDILKTSNAAQCCAKKLGYRKIEPSSRYQKCELWRPIFKRFSQVKSNLRLNSAIAYSRSDGTTRVLYLKINSV